MNAIHPGGCLCGDVRYELTVEPLTFYACHCTDCQRQTGSAFGLSMIVPRSGVRLIKGEPRAFAISMPDGREKRGRFCDRCATRVWGEPAKAPDVLVLRPGTLDDPGAFRPIGNIWTNSARSWVPIAPGDANFEAQPVDPAALVKAWRKRSES